MNIPPGATCELCSVTKRYREGDRSHEVLRNASFTIRPGEFVVLLGRSGSGKSTVLNLVAGLDRPDEGRVLVNGRDLGALSETERTRFRRSEVGFIFQSFNLIATLTVAENVSLRPALNGVSKRDALAIAEHRLEEVGLADRAHSFPDILSGGEQQRVAIAAALAHEPNFILADEPTGNLDAENGARVVGLLDELVRSRGKTLIMATHSREMIGIADRVARIEGGALVEEADGATRDSEDDG